MLRPRLIPCLLIQNKGLVKTQQFKNPKYVGDPINAVRIFNEKEVDEIMILDIDATAKGHEPDYTMIKNLAAECLMPFCYGGGIQTAEQALKIFSLGVEKVALSSAVISNPLIVKDITEKVGSQSVVVVLDVKKDKKNNYFIYTNNGQINTKKELLPMILELEALGIGELVINSIDNDGMMNGYDLELIELVRKSIKIPITIMGGAGNVTHIKELISKYGVIGLAAGSLFVFKGIYRAVLISYPNKELKKSLFQ